MLQSPRALRDAVMSDPTVQAAYSAAKAAGTIKGDIADVVAPILNTMETRLDPTAPRVLGWGLRKMMRQIYEGLVIDAPGLARIRAVVAAGDGPVILLPTHRSYMDFLIASYIFFAYNLPLPLIAAGEDFLGLGKLSQVLRGSGAFFIRRNMRDDPLYSAVLRAYFQALVVANQPVEFFIEGTRSRSGKVLTPKTGMLEMMLQPLADGRVRQMYVVPIVIDYERPLETAMYSAEVCAHSCVRECERACGCACVRVCGGPLVGALRHA